MTYPNAPRPAAPPGGFRPGPPGAARPAPPPGGVRPVPQPGGARPAPSPGGFRPGPPGGARPAAAPLPGMEQYPEVGERSIVEETGHPAVDAVLRSLANAVRLAPAEQIAGYEAAHQVLQETLAGIDR